MTSGQIVGWHFATRQPIRLCWAEGRITAIDVLSKPAPQTTWLAPGLFDLQVNGYAGVDFQQDNISSDELLTAARGLKRDGCSRFFIALITDEWPRLLRRLEHLRTLRSSSLELRTAIAGWHIEGPFLSAEPGFHGAHNPVWMRDATPADISQLRSLAEMDPLLLTLAPERAGAIEAIGAAVANDITVSLGHTDASAEILSQAVQAGARGFTHLGNGCPRALDRHDNILWRVFETAGLTISLIPDQIHVSPALFRLAHRVLNSETIYYTTDAMSAAGAPPGRYRLGNLELDVGPDQIVRQPGKALFAGSALKPIEGVKRAARMLGCPWQQVWGRFSSIPAAFVGLHQSLEVGMPANFCVVRTDQHGEIVDAHVPEGA